MEKSTELEDLRRLLHDLQRARSQAEEERNKAEERALRAEEERDQTKTTLQEYLDLCHTHFSKSLSVQWDRSRSTQGTVTAPRKKCYPMRLLPWEGFLDGQQRRFDKVYEFFHSSSESLKLFPSSRTLEELGQMLCDRRFASEDDLRPHQRFAVESPIGNIVSALTGIEGAREQFELGHGVKFENHSNTLDEEVEEVQERLRIQSLSNRDENTSRPPKADRICVFRDMEDRNALSYLIEYKPPHKLSVADLKTGLRPMNLHREVVQEYRIPTEEEKRQQYDADKKVGSVITQTFHYMIEGGLEYSYVSTGNAFVFLWIQEATPTTVFYHLTTPGEEIQTTDDPKMNAFHTAVGQVLSFSLLAFTSKRRSPEWRKTWRQKLPKWPADGEAILPETPENSKKSKTPPTSDFKGKPPNALRSIHLRARRPGGNACNDEDIAMRYDDVDDGSSSETELRDKETPVRPNRTTSNSAQTTSAESPVSSRTRGQAGGYCTQSCLLGLVQGTALDDNCPNVSAHRGGGPHRRHRIGMQTLASLVQTQLGRTLDHDCEPLEKQGARGNLFKITLASHGYTFVGKATISVFVPDLQHEGRVYGQLKRLQGEVVPVYLGNIQLLESYVDLGVELVHMLLMSWGGEVAESSDALDLEGEIRRSVNQIHEEGVEHNDKRKPNILWNPERRRAMLIDFERSLLLGPAGTYPLQELSLNRKRKQLPARDKIYRQRQLVETERLGYFASATDGVVVEYG